MASQFPTGPQDRVEAFGRRHRTGLLTLLFTDMAGSTTLKQQLGDRAAADLFRRHHELVRETLRAFPQGEEIETAGDSFLLAFATPSDAVEFALRTQVRSRELPGGPLDRIGIHVGEVVVGREGGGHGPKDLFGIQIDTCSRVMSLAKAGQTLMTRAVFDSARQVLKGEDIEGVGHLEWLNHGPYLLKGLDDPVEICEVREAGKSAAGPPTGSDKAQRQVRADEEPILGWRPAVGLVIPNTRWVLERKLGEGGFGEVWLGRHQHSKEGRVFKFCFHADRVRFLKREMTLFRLLKERFGDHPHIVRLYDMNLEQAPFYVEMDYVEGADLRKWVERQGGIDSLPIESRLEIVAQAADALQAAHEAGIIHRDIKPANILIAELRVPMPGSEERQSEQLRRHSEERDRSHRVERNPPFLAKLTDFGIGQVVLEEYLQGITRAGFTDTLERDSSSGTGTQLYMAPELVAGKRASTRSDLYSLGVVLYQLLVGDFTRPLTTDWAKHIPDPLLREDLGLCFAGDPQARFAASAQLAERLRTLPQRRKARRRRAAALAAVTAAVVLGLVTLVAGYALRRARASAETLSRALYVADMNLAQQAWDEGNLERAQRKLRDYLPKPGTLDHRGFEWRYLWSLCQDESSWRLTNFPGHLAAVAFSADQRILAVGGGATVQLLEARTRQQVAELRDPGSELHCLAFSPRDTNLLATAGGGDHLIRVWNLSQRKPAFVLKGAPAGTMCLAFSPDCRLLVSAGHDNSLMLWDVDRRTNVWTRYGAESAAVQAAAFSLDGRTVLSGGGDGGNALLWDVASGDLIARFPLEHTAWINAIAFSPDGQLVATVGNDSRLVLWNFAERRRVASPLVGHQGNIQAVAFSPDQKRIATAGVDHTVRVWDLSLQQPAAIFRGHQAAVASIAFAADGKTLLSAGRDHSLKGWDLDLEHRANVLRGHASWISAVAFSPDGRKLASVDWHRHSLFLWDLPSGKSTELVGHSGVAVCGAFSADGRLVATGSQDHTVRVWDWANGQSRVLTNSFPVHSLAFAPDSKMLIVAGHGLVFWDLTSQQTVSRSIQDLPDANIVTVSQDGRFLASGRPDGRVRLWNYSNGQLLAEFQEQARFEELPNPLAFSSDGSLLASGDDHGRVFLYDVQRRCVLAKMEGHTAAVWSLAFAPDGKSLVSGGGDATIVFWNLATHESALTLRQHLGPVAGLAFTRDGNLMASCGADAMVRLWPAVPLKEVRTNPAR